MTLTFNRSKTNFWKLLAGIGLLALIAGCGDQSDEAAPAAEESAMSAPQADAESTASTPEAAPVEEPAATESASETTATDEPAAATDSATQESTASDSGAAKNHTVEARVTHFDPLVLKIAPGDTVSWTNMAGHNTHFEKGNIPEGVKPWVTPLGKEVSHTFETEGLYLYKCDPHFSMGMVGAIIVGEASNVAAVEKNAKGMYKRALAKAKAQL